MIRLLLALPAVALLASCTSSGNPSNSSGGASSQPTTAAGLSARIISASADVTSAHLRISLSVSGAGVSGTGVEKLSDGKLAALDASLAIPAAGDIRLVYVDGKPYAKLPVTLNPSGKPYLAVTTGSSNATVRLIAPYVGVALMALSPGEVGVLAAAGSAVDVKGHQTIAGVSTTHYALKVEVAKLDPAARDALALGGPSLPLDVWTADDGKLVRVLLGLTAQQQQVPIDITYTDYNKPVTITAPPSDQVGS